MKSLVHKFALLGMALLIALPLCAAEGKRKGGKKGEGKDQVSALKERIAKLDLTEEQKGKVKEVFEKYADKITEARKKIPAELQKALGEARKKAADEGKKGKEAEEAVQASVTLTDEQKKALQEAGELNRAMMKELGGILTPEQREQAGFRFGGGKKKNQ